MATFKDATKNTDLTQLLLVVLSAFFLFKIAKKALPSSTNAEGFGEQTVDNDSSTAGNTTTQNETKSQLRAWIDDVVEHLNGTNWFGAYPEIVNRGANLSKNELVFAISYYNQHYKNTIEGQPKFYDFINDEWDSDPWTALFAPAMLVDDGMYSPLLNKLIHYNLKNY